MGPNFGDVGDKSSRFAAILGTDQYILDEDGSTPFTGDPDSMVAGLGAAPHAYPHQLDEHGKVKEEHQPEAEAEAEAKPRGHARKAE